MIEPAIAFSKKSINYNLPVTGSTAAWESSAPFDLQSFPSWLFRTYNPDISRELNKFVPTEEGQGTQVGLVENEETRVQQTIFQIRASIHIECHVRIADRLEVLFRDAKEEDPTKAGISLGSLRHFFNFVQSENELKYPSITLSPDNNIYISWRPSRDKVFSALFWPDGGVSFAIIKPNERHIREQIRISGKVTADILKETIAPLGALEWILN